MKWRSAAIIVLAFAVAAGGTAFGKSASAPADESFGPFHYTAISVRTKIDALARSYRERWADDASLVHDAGLVESSYTVWAQRYPKDPWLAPTAFHLAELYAVIQSPQARVKALRMFRYVATTFPKTKEGRAARLRVAHGFPALRAEKAVSATPSPYGPRVAPSASPVASAAPGAASAAPSAAASPAASASPPPRLRV